MVGWGSESGHRKGIACLKKIGLRARNGLNHCSRPSGDCDWGS